MQLSKSSVLGLVNLSGMFLPRRYQQKTRQASICANAPTWLHCAKRCHRREVKPSKPVQCNCCSALMAASRPWLRAPLGLAAWSQTALCTGTTSGTQADRERKEKCLLFSLDCWSWKNLAILCLTPASRL